MTMLRPNAALQARGGVKVLLPAFGSPVAQQSMPFAGSPLGLSLGAVTTSSEPLRTAAAAPPASTAVAAPQKLVMQPLQHLDAVEANPVPQSSISCAVNEPVQHASTTTRRRTVMCGGNREWGRADSASTFRGHAMVGLCKAGEQRQDTGRDGDSGAAARLRGQAGSASDLISVPGAILQACGCVWAQCRASCPDTAGFKGTKAVGRQQRIGSSGKAGT